MMKRTKTQPYISRGLFGSRHAVSSSPNPQRDLYYAKSVLSRYYTRSYDSYSAFTCRATCAMNDAAEEAKANIALCYLKSSARVVQVFVNLRDRPGQSLYQNRMQRVCKAISMYMQRHWEITDTNKHPLNGTSPSSVTNYLLNHVVTYYI